MYCILIRGKTRIKNERNDYGLCHASFVGKHVEEIYEKLATMREKKCGKDFVYPYFRLLVLFFSATSTMFFSEQAVFSLATD